MGLYRVPQSADVTDPTVAAAVAFFRKRAPKPEAFAAIPDAAVAIFLEEGFGEVDSALGDRATTPLLQVDAKLWACGMKIASVGLMEERGYNRQAGADATILRQDEEARAFLARCKPSGDANGKTENPRFIDSAGNQPLDAPTFTSALGQPGGSARSDAWIGARADLAGGRGEWQ